jgi:hypothetical protein
VVVLLYLWSKEAPAEVTKAAGFKALADSDVNGRALQVFRDIFLRVYRAFNSPESLPSRLRPIESVEDITRREQTIRGIVGLNISPASPITAVVAKSLTMSMGFSRGISSSSVHKSAEPGSTLKGTLDQLEKISTGDLIDHTYTPFNARELMWKSSSTMLS